MYYSIFHSFKPSLWWHFLIHVTIIMVTWMEKIPMDSMVSKEEEEKKNHVISLGVTEVSERHGGSLRLETSMLTPRL